MISKFLIFIILILVSSFISPERFESSTLNLENYFIDRVYKRNGISAKEALSSTIVNHILSDKAKRLSKDFIITPYFHDRTYFWFKVYTMFTSKQVLIHDKSRLSLVYKYLDFDHIYKSSISRYAKTKLQADLSLEYTKKLKYILRTLQHKKVNFTSDEKDILNLISKNYRIPTEQPNREKFFLKLSNNIRTQTGQRDTVKNAILKYLPYEHYYRKIFTSHKIPYELLALAFVESGFNVNAQSYAGASGIWQLMPTTANSFLPKITNFLDHRANPITSTLAALKLLKQNKMILKRWDLSVAAYNFGPGAIQAFRKKYKGTTTLAIFLKQTKNKSIGFASKNYYSEFLALAHILAYREQIFPIKGIQSIEKTFNTDKLKLYISLCSIRPQKLFSTLNKTSPDIHKLNLHFIKVNNTYPKGSIIISDRALTRRRYYKLKTSELIKSYPKHYNKFAKSFACR